MHSFNLATQEWQTLPKWFGRTKGTGLGHAGGTRSYAQGASYLWYLVSGEKLCLSERQEGRGKAFLTQAASSRALQGGRFCVQKSITANKSCPREIQMGWNPWLWFFPPFLLWPVQPYSSLTPSSQRPPSSVISHDFISCQLNPK